MCGAVRLACRDLQSSGAALTAPAVETVELEEAPDITLHQSDQRRAAGHLSRPGPPALRWALSEATMTASRVGSPDRDYYVQAAERLGV